MSGGRWLTATVGITATLALFGAGSASAAQVTLGFDGQAAGTVIKNQYGTADGVQFGQFTGGPTGDSFTVASPSPSSVASSPPNVLQIGRCESTEIPECVADGYIHFDTPQSAVSFRLGFLSSSATAVAVTVKSYDASGKVVQTVTPTASYGVHTLVSLNSASADISYVEIDYNEFTDAFHSTSIDDLTFASGTGQPAIGINAGNEVWLDTSDDAPATAGTAVKFARYGGSTGDVTLHIQGLPAGVHAHFAHNPFTGGNGASDALTFSAPAGTAGLPLTNLTIVAVPSSGAGTQTVTATLPLHVVNTYNVSRIGIAVSQSNPNGPDTGNPGDTTSYTGTPLVAGMSTTARVFLQPTGLVTAGTSGLSVQLSGYDGSTELPGSPLASLSINPADLGDQPISSQVGDKNASFDFQLPGSWLGAGSFTLIANVSGPGQFLQTQPDTQPNYTAGCTNCAAGPVRLTLAGLNFGPGVVSVPASQCTPAAHGTEQHFDSVVCDVPQLNQMRTACGMNVVAAACLLAPNEWCAPTATMDVFAAFADRGRLSEPTPRRDWTRLTHYAEMTRDLAQLGQDMGTTTSGTGSGLESGAQDWLDAYQRPGSDLLWNMYDPYDASTGVGGAENMLWWLAVNQAAGGLNIAVIGFYDNATQHPQDDPTTQFNPSNKNAFDPLDSYRYGGHVVAVTGVRVNSQGWTLSIHDPANPFENLNTQTPYVTDTYRLQYGQLRTFGPTSGNPFSNPNNLSPRPASNGQGQESWDYSTVRLDGYTVNGPISPNMNQAAYIDGYGMFMPLDAAFPETPASIAVISDPHRRYSKHVYHVPGGVSHLAIDPLDQQVIYYSGKRSHLIRRLDVGTRRATVFANAGAPILQLVAGGEHDGVLARTAHEVIGFDPYGHRVGVIHGSFDTIAVNGSDESLVAASLRSKTLKSYSPAFGLMGTTPLPRTLTRGHGHLTLAIDRTSKQLLVGGANGSLFRALLPAITVTARASAVAVTHLPRRLRAVRLRLRSRQATTLVADDGAGALFGVTANGLVVSYAANGKPTPNPFGHIRIHGELALGQSFNNLTAAYHGPIDTPLVGPSGG
jgi:hypothetical protein